MDRGGFGDSGQEKPGIFTQTHLQYFGNVFSPRITDLVAIQDQFFQRSVCLHRTTKGNTQNMISSEVTGGVKGFPRVGGCRGSGKIEGNTVGGVASE